MRCCEGLRNLIAKGANINLAGQFNLTPLHCAIVFGDFILIKTLLEKGADINPNNA